MSKNKGNEDFGCMLKVKKCQENIFDTKILLITILGAISFFYIAVKLLYFGGLSCLDRRGVALN